MHPRNVESKSHRIKSSNIQKDFNQTTIKTMLQKVQTKGIYFYLKKIQLINKI